MKEKQSVNGRDVWLSVTPVYPERENPNIIPVEYFTVAYSLEGPEASGDVMKDETGAAKLFESPVAAISYASKQLQTNL